MKKTVRLLVALICIASTLALMSLSLFAEGQTSKQGWSYDEDGKERYYVDGVPVKGTYRVGAHDYVFDESDGAYIDGVDTYTNPGNVGVMDTEAYVSAINALGSNVLVRETFNVGRSYANNEALTTQKKTLTSDGITEASNSIWFANSLKTVVNQARYSISKKSGSLDENNLAYTYHHTATFNPQVLSSTGSAHTRIDRAKLNMSSGKIVFEFEVKLSALPSKAMNLIHVAQRYDKDGNGSDDLINADLLMVNTQGYVYAYREPSKLICNIYREEFTRLSVVCDVEANTHDVYCNGILMLEGLRTYDARTEGMPDFEINETRMFQIVAVSTKVPNSCVISVDNIYIYKANDIVCRDTTTPLKNGAYSEGAYIRYYDNGSVCTGKHAVTGQYFSQTLNGQFFDFDAKNGRAFVGFKSTVVNSGVTVSSNFLDRNMYVSPKAVDIPGKKFVGWKVTVGNDSPFLGINNSFRANAEVTSEAVGVELAMLSGASLKTVAGTSELRYIAKISKSDYDFLISLGLSVEPHMIIAPTSVVEKAYGYTDYDTLLAMAGEEQILDIKAESWYTQTDNYYYYTASVGNITDYMKEYSAIAYLNITLQDGTVVTVLSNYSAENNSRSVYYVASRAYNDRTTLKNQEGYGVKIRFDGDNTFSPYSAERLSVVKKFLDAIVSLVTDETKVQPSGRFYDAPYKVDSNEIDTGYNVTLKKSDKNWNVSNISTLLVDGSVLAPELYSVKAEEIQFNLDTKRVQLKAKDDNTDNPSVKLVEVTSESSIFPNVVTFSDLGIPNAPDGSTVGAVWSYDENKTLTSSKGFEEIKSNGYFDLKKYSSISFFVYVPKESIGQTFIVQIHSNNSSTSESDFYRSNQFTFKHEGWTQILINKSELSVTRSPLGWDKIDSVVLNIKGWDQANSSSTELYVTDIYAYEKEIVERNIILETATSDGGAAFALGGYAAIVNGKHNPINPNDTETVVFEENGKLYLPVNSFALAKDENACFYSNSMIVTYTDNGKDYVFRAGEDKYHVGKDRVKLQNKLIGKNGAVYMASEDVMTVFGYSQIFRDQMGLIVLSNKENIIGSYKDSEAVFKEIQSLMCVRPTGEKIVSDMMEYSGGTHPYLMVDKKAFEELSYYAKNEALLKQYIAKLEEGYGIGTSRFKAAPNSFKRTDGKRLLSVSRDVRNKTLNWALLYKLGDYTAEEKELIVNRIWAEVEAAANFFDTRDQKLSWNPEHFLDTAELAYPMAIMYDWFYDEWTPEQRSIIAKAIYDLALKQTSVIEGEYEYVLGGDSNNWNGVCNGGIMAAALAIVNDEYIVNNNLRDDVIAVIGTSIKAVENGMWAYAPDGGYQEGPGYWGYGTTYLHVFMSCLNSACGTNYGLYDSPGFEESAYYTTYLANANTTWGFHDGESVEYVPDNAAWFARISGDGSLNAIRREAIENGWCGAGAYDIMWFSPHIVSNSVTLALDNYYSLDTIMTFRSSWDSSNNIFAGLHGGDNTVSHADLDVGNFVINVNGTFMICDLGKDAYNMEGYFGVHRWSYYRKRTEGQNTLVMIGHGVSWKGKTGSPQTAVINPETGKPYLNRSWRVTQWEVGAEPDSKYYGQKLDAVSKAVAFKSGVSSAYGIVDMAPAYYSVADGTNMWRGLWMKDNRSTVVLQDEGEFTTAKDIWWFAHTEGDITIIGDGRSAYIYRDGIYLYAEIVTDPNNPIDAKFSVMEAVSLDEDYVGDTVNATDYTDSTEYSRESFSKLTIAVQNYDVCNIAVVFKVISSPEDIPELGTTYAWTPMSQWTAE